MNDSPGASNEIQDEHLRLAELKRKKKRTMAINSLSLGVLCAAGVVFLGLGWMVAGALCVAAAVKTMSELRRKMLEFDLEIAFAELDRERGGLPSQRKSIQEMELEVRAQQETMLAGIEFNTPAGRFEEQVVYRYAVKDGRAYEYAGLAVAMDEPGPDMLIVNDLIYKRVAA